MLKSFFIKNSHCRGITMTEIRKIKECFQMAILKVNEDRNIVYAISLDGLCKWKENNVSSLVMSDIITRNYFLSSEKLSGIMLALHEFKKINEIPEILYENLCELVKKRIFDDVRGDEFEWITKIFELIQDRFSCSNYTFLISLLIDETRNLPERYIKKIIALVAKYINENANNSVELKYLLKKDSKRIFDLIISRRRANSDHKTLYCWIQLLKAISKPFPWMRFLYKLISFKVSFIKLLKYSVSHFSTTIGVVCAISTIVAFLGLCIDKNIGAILFPAIFIFAALIFFVTLRIIFKNPINDIDSNEKSEHNI